MKTLPDDPDLDHLRRQAKDLLAGLRPTRPTATLAGAQSALARQYGFRDWPELKAEVERRAGTADVAAPAVAAGVAAAFGLGDPTRPMRSLARPDDAGRRWSLTTTRGRWAVRTVDGVHPPTDGEAGFALQEAAAAAGVLLPRPVRSLAGPAGAVVDGQRWQVHAWCHSAPPLTAPVGADAARAAGEVLARVHGIAAPVDRISGWYAPLHGRDEWRRLVAAADGWGDALAGAARGLGALHRAEEDVTERPVLVHNNLTPGNCRFAAGRLVVTGWEHAGGQPPGWELGQSLLQWTVDPDSRVNVESVQALLSGYRAVAGAVPVISFRGALAALSNYLFGQAAAAMAEEHARRSTGHLLAHLPTATTLAALRSACGAAIDR